MTKFAAIVTLLAASFATLAAADAALANDRPPPSAIRDHTGPQGAPSGGVIVNKRNYDVTYHRACHNPMGCGSRPAPRPAHTVVRDHRN